MKTITQISMQSHSGKHCNIYLDGSFYCGLRLETVLTNRLKVGDVIEEKKLDEIQEESEYTHALDKAMGYLEKSAKTKKQIADYLAKKGYTKALIEKVMAKLEDYSFVNDKSFAEQYLESAKLSKGTFLIARELKQKGIDENTLKEVLDDAENDFEVAFKIGEKFLKGKPCDRENLSKCYRKLLSRGFDYDTCSQVIEKLKKTEDI